MRESSTTEARLILHLTTVLGALLGGGAVERRVDGLWIEVPTAHIRAMAEAMHRLAAGLSAISGLTLSDGETAILYHYCLGNTPINIRTCTCGGAIASITSVTRAADWAEREIADLYGVRFEDHPAPGRLLRPPSLQPGFFREAGSASGGGQTEEPSPPSANA